MSTTGQTKKDIIIHLLTNASDLYHKNFPRRNPREDYRFMSTTIGKDCYQIIAQRLTSPTITELSYELSDFFNVSSLRDSEVQYYIRNKIYCFIHYIYQFHMGEKFGREEMENIFKTEEKIDKIDINNMVKITKIEGNK